MRLLAQNRLDARQVAAHAAHLGRRLELPHRLLNPQPEQLVVEVALAHQQVGDRQLANLRRLHDTVSCSKRIANLVLIGSLAEASRIALRASTSLTPSISNSTLPGRTTHTHCSGAPLPLPIRVSCGFLVIGLSGKMRTQILPPRLMNRVIATRAASICRSVIHAGSSACSPKSPNDTSEPRQALPRMRPRCCFRNLTFFGINIGAIPAIGE